MNVVLARNITDVTLLFVEVASRGKNWKKLVYEEGESGELFETRSH